MARCRLGDDAAFRLLYERHKGRVVAHARSMLGDDEAALDVLQEAFLYVFRLAPRWEPRARFTTLLFRAVRSLCLDRIARGRLRAAEPLPEDLRDAAAPDPSRRSEDADDARRVDAAIAALAPAHREVVLLRLREGMSTDEVASVVRVPVGTVKSRLHHALAALRAALSCEPGGGADA